MRHVASIFVVFLFIGACSDGESSSPPDAAATETREPSSASDTSVSDDTAVTSPTEVVEDSASDDTGDTIEVPETTEVPDTTVMLDTIEVPETTAVLDTTEVRETTEVLDTTVMLDTTEVPDTIEVPETIEVPDTAEPEDTSEVPETFEPEDTTEPLDLSDPTETIEAETIEAADTVDEMPDHILVNEVLIPAYGADPSAFVELAGPPGASLAGLTLEHVYTDGIAYQEESLGGALDENGYFVVASPSSTAEIRAAADMQSSFLDVAGYGPGTIRLREGQVALDAVGYGAFTSTQVFVGEVEPFLGPSWPTESFGRDPQSSDTDDNTVDIHELPVRTPGAANIMSAPAPTCDDPSTLLLPPMAADGYGDVDERAVTRRGRVLGAFGERAPRVFDRCEHVAIDNATKTYTLDGWTFDAVAGERVDLDPQVALYGPIAGCRAGKAFEDGSPVGPPVTSEISGQWKRQYVAPASGTYFVAPTGTPYRKSNGTFTFVGCPTSSTTISAGLRRLDDSGAPRGHHLITTQAWGDLTRPEMRVAPLSAGAPPSIVMLGRALLQSDNHRYLQVASRDAQGVWSMTKTTACQANDFANDWATPLVGDFDVDGATDVIWDHNLFFGDASGGFTCQVLDFWLDQDVLLGPYDVDGDGHPDVLDLEVQPMGDTQELATDIRVRVYYYRDGQLVQGALRTYRLENVAVWYGTLYVHPGLKDLDDDGVPEIAMAIQAEVEGIGYASFDLAFAMPTEVDDESWDHEIALDPVDVPTSEPWWWGRLRPDSSMIIDVDGDRIEDTLAAARWAAAKTALRWGYGDGTEVLVSWMIDATSGPGNGLGGTELPTIDRADFDGDGCVDFAVAVGGGVVLVSNRNCVP